MKREEIGAVKYPITVVSTFEDDQGNPYTKRIVLESQYHDLNLRQLHILYESALNSQYPPNRGDNND